MMGKTDRQQEQLKAQVEEAGRPQWAEHVTEEAEILGTALTRSGRVGTKQTKRMTKFTDRLAMIQAIPFRTRADFHIAVRILANSVASYGWVTTAPSETQLNAAGSKIWNSKRLGLKGAARHLKWMAEGARTHLTPVIASRLIGVVSRLKQAEEADWRAPAHTVVATLKSMLKNLGWEEIGQFAWQHQSAGYIEMEASTDLIKKFQHQIRESFRHKCWTQFFERTKRHEIKAMSSTPEHNSNRAKQIQQIASRGGIQAVLMTGGIRSPACVQKFQRDTIVLPTTCPGCEEEGFFDHVYWRCSAVPLRIGKQRPEPPLEPMQRRYGWPLGTSRSRDEEIIDWMSAVTTLIWDRRYQNTTVKLIKNAAIEKRQRARQQSTADNEDTLMREEEAWRHIQEQDVDNDEEEDQETVPKDRLELSRKRPQESKDEQKESNVDQRRPIRTRRLEKGPSQPTESQQESASSSKGSRKGRPTGDQAIADESQETGRLLDLLDQWYENTTQVQIPVQGGQRGDQTNGSITTLRRWRAKLKSWRPLHREEQRGNHSIRNMRRLFRRRAELRCRRPLDKGVRGGDQMNTFTRTRTSRSAELSGRKPLDQGMRRGVQSCRRTQSRR